MSPPGTFWFGVCGTLPSCHADVTGKYRVSDSSFLTTFQPSNLGLEVRIFPLRTESTSTRPSGCLLSLLQFSSFMQVFRHVVLLLWPYPKALTG